MTEEAIAIAEDGTRSNVPVTRALRLAHDGTPVIFPAGLMAFGLHHDVNEAFLDEISRLSSPPSAEILRSAGLQRMHDVLSADQVAELLGRLDRRMGEDVAVRLATRVVETAAEPRPHYFGCARTFVRAQVPVRLLEGNTRLLTAGHLAGHLRPVKAHRDFQLTHPRGSLSIWCAVGPIRKGNTLLLYNEGAQNLPPIAPELSPGDVLVFNADRLHASVPNFTDETRVGIGTRIVLGRWLRFGPGTHWRPWYDGSLVGTPLEPLATLQSRLTPAAFRRWRWRRHWKRQQLAGATE